MFGFAASLDGVLLDDFVGPLDEINELTLFHYCNWLIDFINDLDIEIPVFFHNGIKFDNNLFLKRLPDELFGFELCN